MYPVKVIVAGAGGRGTSYAAYAQSHPEQMQVVAVAEPRDYYREQMAKVHGIRRENCFADWKQMAARPKFADAVIIATQDAMHAEPAVAFANLGYDMLLEKPMAPTAQECRRIVEAVEKNKILFAVCHVLRYTNYTQQLKKILDSGAIGDIVSIEHLEQVGYWHQAHSFVRGSWGNEKVSSFMLLAKSCHDLDWLHYLIGRSCTGIASFGSLYHFRKEHQPAGAADRCLDCAVAASCPYSGQKIYLERVKQGQVGWPVNVLTTDTTLQGVTEALRTGPYGRCVYACDNDVVDHQVVMIEFEGGITASFTMTAFTETGDRQTRIFGTKGQLTGNGETIEILDFLTDKKTKHDVNALAGNILGGHGGGDYNLMSSFIPAVAEKDPKRILSGPSETLESHLLVFAAEESRRQQRVVRMDRWG